MSDNMLCLTILESSKVAKYRDVIYLMHIVLLRNITKPLHQNLKTVHKSQIFKIKYPGNNRTLILNNCDNLNNILNFKKLFTLDRTVIQIFKKMTITCITRLPKYWETSFLVKA